MVTFVRSLARAGKKALKLVGGLVLLLLALVLLMALFPGLRAYLEAPNISLQTEEGCRLAQVARRFVSDGTGRYDLASGETPVAEIDLRDERLGYHPNEDWRETSVIIDDTAFTFPRQNGPRLPEDHTFFQTADLRANGWFLPKTRLDRSALRLYFADSDRAYSLDVDYTAVEPLETGLSDAACFIRLALAR